MRCNDRPFGGIQLVLCGDFLQLPPVAGKGQSAQFCFQAMSWLSCVTTTIHLDVVFRQKSQAFVTVLNDLRLGTCSPAAARALNACKGRRLDTSDGIEPTTLYSRRFRAENENEQVRCLSISACKR